QFGGTNNPGAFVLGNAYYVLSNGVLNAASMTLTTNTSIGGINAASFQQYGGYVTNGGLTMIGGRAEGFKGQELISPAKYYLYHGTLETPSITLNFGDIDVGNLGVNATNILGTLSMGAESVYSMNSGAYVSVNQL